MLIFTLTMEILLTLVSVACLVTLSQSVTVRDEENLYEPQPKQYIYSEPQSISSHAAQDGQLQYYKTARQSGRIPVQYVISEDTIPESDNYPSQQPLEANSNSLQTYEQQLTRRFGAIARKPQIEQYLKEVTPTTKTTYVRRIGNYQRSHGQETLRANKQQAEERQRSLQKQFPFQYVLQPELQQKPQPQPQIQYEIPEQKQTQPQQPDTTLAQYQNALLAHQKILLEASTPEESKSSIYVNHAIPKKPTRKLVKPKQSPADEEAEYITQFQQYQQQPQLKFYEQQQPAQVMYQAKIQYQKEGSTPDESSLYQQQLRQYQPQIAQYISPASRQAKKTRHPAKYQHPTQEAPELSYEYQTVTKPEEQAAPQRATPLRQGPKYLPEPKTERYQQPPVEVSSQYEQAVLPGQQPLLSYEAAIARLQSEQARARPQSTRQQPVYRPQERPVKYQLQYADESQQEANQEEAEVEYVRPQQASRLRSVGRNPAYRQVLPSSNVRFYRNLARPVPYTSYE